MVRITEKSKKPSSVEARKNREKNLSVLNENSNQETKEYFSEKILVENKTCDFFSESELSEIILYARRDSRLYCLVLLLVECGLRKFEVEKLNVEDIDLIAEEINITNSRTIPLGKSCIESIKKYMEQYNIDSNAINTPFFQYSIGKRWKSKSMQDALQRMGRNIGLKNCCFYKFRNSFAVYFLLYGGSILFLKKFMGYKCSSFAYRYLEIIEQLENK